MSGETICAEDILYALAEALGYEVTYKQPLENEANKAVHEREKQIEKLAKTYTIKQLTVAIEMWNDKGKALLDEKRLAEEKRRQKIVSEIMKLPEQTRNILKRWYGIGKLVKAVEENMKYSRIDIKVEDYDKRINEVREKIRMLEKALIKKIKDKLGVKSISETYTGVNVTL